MSDLTPRVTDIEQVSEALADGFVKVTDDLAEVRRVQGIHTGHLVRLVTQVGGLTTQVDGLTARVDNLTATVDEHTGMLQEILRRLPEAS